MNLEKKREPQNLLSCLHFLTKRKKTSGMPVVTPIKFGRRRRRMWKKLPPSICSICIVLTIFLVIVYNPMQMITVSPAPVNYQVFINFRGEQLRHNFVGHLTNALETHGIKYFIDKNEQLGKDLKNLFVRIEESRIAIAIFSTRYPESKWCMNELVKMKKLSDEGKLHVIPIFYKVNPSHVKKPIRKSEFGKNFWKFVETSRVEDPIQEWREALECIANKSGLPLGDESSEADFIQEIVMKVQRLIEAMGLEKE